MLLLTVAAAVALSTSTPFGPPPRQVPAVDSSALEQAEALLEAGNLKDAESTFRRLYLEHPNEAAALRGWARALILQDRGATALAPLTTAAARRYEAGLYEEAAVLFELALQIEPDDGQLAGQLGRVYLLDRQFHLAEQHLRRALALEPRTLDLRLPLAAALWENGELEDADRSYRQAVTDAPGSQVAHYQLGRFLLWRGKFEEAVVELRRAGELGADGVEFLLDRARALEELARELAGSERQAETLEEAQRAFERAVEAAPEHSEARYGLSRVLQLRGEDAEAQRQLDVYRELYREDHDNTRSQQRLEARVKSMKRLVVEGRPHEAVAQLEALPATPESLRALALAYSSLGDVNAAEEALERAVVMAPERTDLQAQLAELRRRKGG